MRASTLLESCPKILSKRSLASEYLLDLKSFLPSSILKNDIFESKTEKKIIFFFFFKCKMKSQKKKKIDK